MIPVKLIEANNFQLQKKTYKKSIWCIIDSYAVFLIFKVHNGRTIDMYPELTV